MRRSSFGRIDGEGNLDLLCAERILLLWISVRSACPLLVMAQKPAPGLAGYNLVRVGAQWYEGAPAHPLLLRLQVLLNNRPEFRRVFHMQVVEEGVEQRAFQFF